jgi:hypothetical protein
MIQHNADHCSPMSSSSDASQRPGRPQSGSEPKLAARCWPFPAAEWFTVAAPGNARERLAGRPAASSFVT